MTKYIRGADWASGPDKNIVAQWIVNIDGSVEVLLVGDSPNFAAGLEMQIVRELRVVIPEDHAIDFNGFRDEIVRPGIATRAIFHYESRGFTVEIDGGQNWMADAELLRAFLPIAIRHLSKIEDENG